MELILQQVDLQNKAHCEQLIKLLNDYMNDPMGNNSPMEEGLAPRIIAGLQAYAGYLGFFVLSGDQYAGLANCNQNFSTFKAKALLNIHDFIVAPEFRNIGAGHFLMQGVLDYASRKGFCRVNLEVREDNHAAKALYQKMGFRECEPPMHFLELNFGKVL
ncbi:MAG TPA: GNAT family N-acetyltransferase [Prolixibacteraceae bacterium]|jgi:ribosomal protein S18 acetylase RimI-like enzyme|nr:GNAT family N-acetyltransferase [Prolixibacteraceae bacterium]